MILKLPAKNENDTLTEDDTEKWCTEITLWFGQRHKRSKDAKWCLLCTYQNMVDERLKCLILHNTTSLKEWQTASSLIVGWNVLKRWRW